MRHTREFVLKRQHSRATLGIFWNLFIHSCFQKPRVSVLVPEFTDFRTVLTGKTAETKCWSGPCPRLDLAEVCYLSEPQFPCLSEGPGGPCPERQGLCRALWRGLPDRARVWASWESLRVPQKGLNQKV